MIEVEGLSNFSLYTRRDYDYRNGYTMNYRI